MPWPQGQELRASHQQGEGTRHNDVTGTESMGGMTGRRLSDPDTPFLSLSEKTAHLSLVWPYPACIRPRCCVPSLCIPALGPLATRGMASTRTGAGA